MNERIIFIGDVVEANGKTVRQNNEATQHRIPIGTLVEVKYDEWYGTGACAKVHARLFVVMHSRDCDGTPLYTLSRSQRIVDSEPAQHGFNEESLTIIPLTTEVRDGYNVLEWEQL